MVKSSHTCIINTVHKLDPSQKINTFNYLHIHIFIPSTVPQVQNQISKKSNVRMFNINYVWKIIAYTYIRVELQTYKGYVVDITNIHTSCQLKVNNWNMQNYKATYFVANTVAFCEFCIQTNDYMYVHMNYMYLIVVMQYQLSF